MATWGYQTFFQFQYKEIPLALKEGYRKMSAIRKKKEPPPLFIFGLAEIPDYGGKSMNNNHN